MRRIILFTLLVLLTHWANARTKTAASADSAFTLQEAIDYALEHNHEVQKAELEIIKAKKKVWETTAIGLPQVSGQFAYSYMLTVPDALEQFSSIGDYFIPIYDLFYANGMLPEQQYQAIVGALSEESVTTDDIRWGATLDVSVSQLIFNGSYIVGLQASKTYQRLSKYLMQQKEDDIRETVIMAYTGVVIARENVSVLEDILKSTNKTIEDMEAIHKEGFIENTDVDQLRLTAATIETTLKNLELQVKVAKEMLKLSMGMQLDGSIQLNDGLDEIMVAKGAMTSKELDFDVTENINYQLIDTQEKLTELNLKNSKAEFLPTVAAFYNHQENFNDKAFNLNPPDIVGVNVSIPIFSSWQRMSKLQQRQIELDQMKHDKANAVSGLRIQYRNTLNGYLTAKNNYQNSKSNMELAKRIYEKTQVKYKEGVSSSFDLSQAQGQYLQSQSNYFQAAMKLIEAKTQLDKLRESYEPIQE